ncbi:MAG: hypothetical protein LBL01_07830, partial [Bifidobacteriaceae bacterium]|nr:hypothetical protein [Bifidobacteriaceae bacterium]
MASDKKSGGISVIQVLASALAAATATLALSYLGVAGTILGAALASVITVVGNYVYSRSLSRGHKAVKTLAHQAATMVLPSEHAGASDPPVPDAAAGPPAPPDLGGDQGEAVGLGAGGTDGTGQEDGPAADLGDLPAARPVAAGGAGDAGMGEDAGGAGDGTGQGDRAAGGLGELPAARPVTTAGDAGAGAAEGGGLGDLPQARPVATAPDARDKKWMAQMVARYGTTRTLVALGIAVFVLIMGIVTAVELVLHKPLSDELTGKDSGQRTTFQWRKAQLPPVDQNSPAPAPSTTPAAPPTTPATTPPQVSPSVTPTPTPTTP